MQALYECQGICIICINSCDLCVQEKVKNIHLICLHAHKYVSQSQHAEQPRKLHYMEDAHDCETALACADELGLPNCPLKPAVSA